VVERLVAEVAWRAVLYLEEKLAERGLELVVRERGPNA